MSSELSPPRKILSMDDIRAGLSDMAENGDGAQRAQAYRMLMNMEGTSVALPAPTSDEEVMDRLARIMRGAGRDLTRGAYSFAFPSRLAKDTESRMTYGQATPEMVAESKRVMSLKDLYRRYPETKRSGVPPGYPSGRSIETKVAWCRDQALKILVEREVARRNEAKIAMTATDSEIRGATDGSPSSETEDPEA